MDLNIPFESNWKNVAISLSGGADSALLAYMICDRINKENLNTTVHIISHIRNWKSKPWQQYDSLRVYSWLIKRFSNINFQRHTNFIAPDLEYEITGPTLIDEYDKKVSGDNIQQRAYAEYICKFYEIEAYFNGVTKNPKDQDFNGMVERNIEKNKSNEHLEKMLHMGTWALHPFRFVDKSVIVKMYKELDLLDLLSITRSCEGTFEGITYKTYSINQYIPLCQKCFWCKERQWALIEAGLE